MAANELSDDLHHGRCVMRDDAKSFGFILDDNHNIEKDVYFNISDAVGSRMISKGDRLTYRLQKTLKGFRARVVRHED